MLWYGKILSLPTDTYDRDTASLAAELVNRDNHDYSKEKRKGEEEEEEILANTTETPRDTMSRSLQIVQFV